MPPTATDRVQQGPTAPGIDLELIMQPLLGGLTVDDYAATVTHRSAQRVYRRLLGMWSTRTLAR